MVVRTLETVVDGIRHSNPGGLGSGPPFDRGSLGRYAQESGWGFGELKTVSLNGIVNVGKPWYWQEVSDLDPIYAHLNWELTSHHPLSWWLEELRKIRSICASWPVYGSIIEAYEEQCYARLVEALDPFVAAYVINGSCPHGFTAVLAGGKLALQPLAVGNVCRWVVKAASGKPVYFKVNPNGGMVSIREQIRAALEAGAAGVVVANTYEALPPLLPHTLKRRAAIQGKHMSGGLSGRGVLPMTLFKVRASRVYMREIGFPEHTIIASGGAWYPMDVADLMARGANLVEICTAAMRKRLLKFDPKSAAEINTGGVDEHGLTADMLTGLAYGGALADAVGHILDINGLSSPAELVSCAVDDTVTQEELVALGSGSVPDDRFGKDFESGVSAATT